MVQLIFFNEAMKNYRFEEFKEFFSFQLSHNVSAHPGQRKETLSRLAAKLGYKSPSLLTMIAKGQRLPSTALLESLFEKWEIPISEREAIRLQVEIEKRKKKNKNYLGLLDRLEKLQGTAPYQKIEFNQFETIRHWYVYVLKELVDTKTFKEDPILLSKKLRNKVSPSQIRKALDSLMAVGLVRRGKAGKLESVVRDTETPNGVPSEAIQEYHKSMMERAIEALREQDVERRHANALTFRFEPKNLQLVKNKIFEFMKQINTEFSSDTSEKVFQLNVQFFEHTGDSNEK